MAQYGYSAGYQGGGPSPVPSGYIEAYANAGRSIGQGIASIGKDVQDTIREYAKNKAEDQYATSKIESMLAQYAGSTQGQPTADGATAGMDHLAGIIGQKNLDAFVSGKANRMQKLAIANSLETYGAQQHQRLQNEYLNEQLKGIQEQQRQQKALVEIQKAVAGLPTTTSTTGEVTTTVPGETVPAMETQGPPEINKSAYAEALKAYGTKPDQQQKISELQSQIAALRGNTEITPATFTVPNAYGPSFGGLAPAVKITETPQAAALRAAEALKNQPKIQELQSQVDALKSAPAGEMPKPEQFLKYPEPTKPYQLPPTTKTTSETVVKPVDPEQYRKQIAQEFANRGIPVTPELLNQTAQIAGVQLPIQAQTLSIPGVGTAVKVDGKEQFVPVNPDMLRHIEASSINIPGEVNAQFRTTQDREKFSEDLTTYKEINNSVNKLTSIVDKYPGVSGQVVRSLSPTVSAEIQNNLNSLRSHLNKQITGGGNLSETDYKRIDAVIADPSKFFTMDSATKTKLLGLSQTAKSNLQNKFKATTVSGSLNLGGPQPYNQGGAMKTLTYNPVTKSME
jgi:hypothetical protein